MISTTVITTCDVCERVDDDAQELRFSVRGHDLVVDLCDGCQQIWNASIGPFVGAARRAPRRVAHSIRPGRR